MKDIKLFAQAWRRNLHALGGAHVVLQRIQPRLLSGRRQSNDTSVRVPPLRTLPQLTSEHRSTIFELVNNASSEFEIRRQACGRLLSTDAHPGVSGEADESKTAAISELATKKARYIPRQPVPSDSRPQTSVAPVTSAAFLSRLSDDMKSLRDELTSLTRRNFRRSERQKLFLVSLCVGGLMLFLIGWERVKRTVGHRGAEVISEGIQNKDLKISAEELAKSLLAEVLDDDQLRAKAAAFLSEALGKVNDDITSLAADTVGSDVVIERASESAVQMLRSFCQRKDVKDALGKLIFEAVDTPEMHESAEKWFSEVFSSEAVASSFENAIASKTVSNPEFQDEASTMLAGSAKEVLNDPDLQKHASRVLWSIIKGAFNPWARNATTNLSHDMAHDHRRTPSPPNASDEVSPPAGKPVNDEGDVSTSKTTCTTFIDLDGQMESHRRQIEALDQAVTHEDHRKDASVQDEGLQSQRAQLADTLFPLQSTTTN